MSGLPAARLGDGIICALPQATPAALPHAPPPTGLPITPPCAVRVLIDGRPAARVGDRSFCLAPIPTPNPILRGAFPVPIMNMPAARVGDSATHPGSLIAPPCCPTVLIGLAGTTGNPKVAEQACRNLANERTSGSQNQSYNNCGIESSRQVINHATGGNVSEDALLQTAKNNPAINSSGGIGTPGSANVVADGGTTPRQQAALLNSMGVPSSVVPATAAGAQLSQYELALSQGRGVLSGGDVSGLPPSANYGGSSGAHAVVVTGFEYDDAGNLTHVHYNDTNSRCGSKITAAEFQNFMDMETADRIANGFTPFGTAITDNPIW